MFAGVVGGGAADVWVSPEAQFGVVAIEFDEANGDEQACGDQRDTAVGGVGVVASAS